jgi:asparagine synthase (glutamine-hydrolysing)
MAAATTPGRPSPASSGIGYRAGLWVDDTAAAPRFYSEERYLVAIAGDPYWSVPELAARAEERGHAEALLEAFRRHRQDLFRFLHGPFSLALIDLEAGEAILAIDRFGIHSMYVAEVAGGLVFGATADSVRAHPAVSSTVDPQAIYNYFNYYTVPASGTIYNEQRKLLAAQVLHYRDGAARQSFYWSLDYSPEPRPRSEALVAELHEILARSVARAVGDAGEVAVGAFLSGGLDSSTVVGVLRKVSGAAPRTFTVGFPAEGYDEMHYARIAAKHFAANSHEHYLTAEETADAIPRIAAFYDEPFGNSSAVPTYFCARSAKERGVDLLLAGDGGDELFAGNARYASETARERYFRILQGLPRIVIGGPLTLLGSGPMARRVRDHVALLTTPLPDRMLAYEHVAPDAARTMFVPDFLREVDLEAPLALARETYHRTSSPAALHRMMHMDLRITLADNDLRKVSTMCRMAGVRVRFPFLDEEVAAFAAKIPADILLRNGELRAFYKRAMRGFLPQEVIEKKKHGFGMPYDVWIHEDRRIREIATEAARSFGRRGICEEAHINALVQKSGEGDGRAASSLWDVMMLELWLQAHGTSP